jgi:predicted DNA-binding antitoxin AbrB/MazE fold protein
MNETIETIEEKGILKKFAIKIKNGEYIELFLRKGTNPKNNYATYISLSLILNKKKHVINLNKGRASQLAVMLNQLIMEGNNIDYETLRKIYPEQKSWHIY